MNGRTQKSIRNVKVMMTSRIINIFLSFLTRTFFIKYLGAEYLGINGLFTNILTILSFAELGIGNAIIFKLYKPVADNDIEKIKTLMHFYKKVYFIIGIIVFILGIGVLPFINYFINGEIGIHENIYLIYFLFLVETAASYFFTYKRSIIIANQDEYIISIINLITNVIGSIAKILMLILTKHYIAYLILSILLVIINDIIIVTVANKKYRFIVDTNYKKIDTIEKNKIFNDVKSILLYKIGFILSNGTDNIIISKFLGVIQVGLLSNYTMITTAINNLISSAFNSLTGSIGNLNTIDNTKTKEKVFYEILYLSFLIYGTISICIILLSNIFINIWLGKDYTLSFPISFALGFNLYVDGMRFVNYSFRNTLGLFKKGRYIPLVSSICNVILSIILVRYIGMFGVLIATGLTRLFILTLYDPYLIHKYAFKSKCNKYYYKYTMYLLLCGLTFIPCYIVNAHIHVSGLIGFIIYGIIDVMICSTMLILFTIKSNEFKSLKERFLIR